MFGNTIFFSIFFCLQKFFIISIFSVQTMSNSNEFKVTENSNEWINWIEEAISKKHIKYYEYECFHDVKEIGSGSFGKVYCANWRNSHKYFALKSFSSINIATVKEIVHEVITI